MPIPGSGAISFADLRNEFGGGNPVRISDYFRGGPRVPNTGTNAGVPTSGIVYLSQYRNASASTPLTASVPDINASRLPNGSATRSTTVTASGGTGSYSLTNAVLLSGSATVSRSGMSVNVTASATNAERNGSVRVTISDGATTITRDFNFYMQFGTPL
ncbi:hypothetical protein [Xanthomonas phage X1]|nr:hypothetical protein [Xanthomonas phage X1]